MALGDKIKMFRKKKGISVNEAARRAGMNASYWSAIERGVKTNPSVEFLEKMAAVLDVPVNVLVTREEWKAIYDFEEKFKEKADRLINKIDPEKMALIPILGTIRAGEPIFAEQNIIGCDYIEREKAVGNILFELRVVGDSMNKDGITEGDYVIVRQQFDVEDGEIAVVLLNGEEATVKRVYKVNGNIVLVPNSTNPEHKPKVINPMETDIRILGKVIGLKRFF